MSAYSDNSPKVRAHASRTSINLLLIGPPGSGKGTQGTRIAEALGLEHIAVGDLLRAELAAGTPLGAAARDRIEHGELVPDDLVIDLIVPHALAAAARTGYVLDGFPRSVPQATQARQVAEPAGARPDLVVYLDVPHDVVVERLLARAGTERRADDTEDVIRHRLTVFADATAPLLDYYRREHLVRVVDATASPDEVTAAILDLVDTIPAVARFDSPLDLLDSSGSLGTSDWLVIDQHRINVFADTTGDQQWIHVDPERAKASPFGSTIAHGYLTLSLIPVMLGQVIAIDGVHAAVNYGLNKVRFPTPVPVDSKVRGHVRLVSATRRGDAVEAVYGVSVEVEGSTRPACVVEAIVLYT